MKKNIITIGLSILSVAASYAGDISEKKNLFSILGGFSVNSLNYETKTDANKGAKVGGMAGFGFEHRFEHVAAIELDALYTNKGAQSKTDNALLKTTNRLNFHSVEVPILVKFYLGKKKIFNINVGGFASYSFYTQLTVKGTNKITDGNVDEKTDNFTKKANNPQDINGKRYFRPYDAGVTGGFEFVSQKGFGAGTRVEQGFIDFTNPKFEGPVIANGSIIPYDDDGKTLWHTGVQFYFVYKF